MTAILGALRTALASYEAEVLTLSTEEESVVVYLDRLRARKAKLASDIKEIRDQLEEKGESGA